MLQTPFDGIIHMNNHFVDCIGHFLVNHELCLWLLYSNPGLEIDLLKSAEESVPFGRPDPRLGRGLAGPRRGSGSRQRAAKVNRLKGTKCVSVAWGGGRDVRDKGAARGGVAPVVAVVDPVLDLVEQARRQRLLPRGTSCGLESVQTLLKRLLLSGWLLSGLLWSGLLLPGLLVGVEVCLKVLSRRLLLGLRLLLTRSWLLGLTGSWLARTLLLLRGRALLNPAVGADDKLVGGVHALQRSLLLNGPEFDVSSERRNLLSASIDRSFLRNSIIRFPAGRWAGLCQDGLSSPVSNVANGSGTSIATVTSLSEVSVTRGIGLPGAITAAD